MELGHFIQGLVRFVHYLNNTELKKLKYNTCQQICHPDWHGKYCYKDVCHRQRYHKMIGHISQLSESNKCTDDEEVTKKSENDDDDQNKGGNESECKVKFFFCGRG